MEFEQILQIIDHVSDSNLTSFQYDSGSVKLSMKCGKGTAIVTKNVDMSMEDGGISTDPGTAFSGMEYGGEGKKGHEITEPKGKLIKSPLVGTFYAAPSEDAVPFVTVGDQVKKGQVLAIVEAMKLMNEIESDFEGRIAEIYVENGQTVEYGQALFRMEDCK